MVHRRRSTRCIGNAFVDRGERCGNRWGIAERAVGGGIVLGMLTCCALLGTILAFPPAVSAADGAWPQVPCGGGGCICVPNAKNFGYYPTKWRRWPGEQRPGQAFSPGDRARGIAHARTAGRRQAEAGRTTPARRRYHPDNPANVGAKRLAGWFARRLARRRWFAGRE